MRVVFVVAENGFRDEELFIPREILAKKEIECVIASKHIASLKGMGNNIVESKVTLREVDNGFDAIIFVGGSGAAQYFQNSEALGLAKKYFDLNRVVAAICIAPSILANAGILKGKKVTSFASEKTNLEDKGAIYLKSPVVVDGKLVTASGPAASKQFAEEIIKLLKR